MLTHQVRIRIRIRICERNRTVTSTNNSPQRRIRIRKPKDTGDRLTVSVSPQNPPRRQSPLGLSPQRKA